MTKKCGARLSIPGLARHFYTAFCRPESLQPPCCVRSLLLLMTFPCARKLGNICCGHRMFLNKIRNIFCVPDTKFVSATNVARVAKRRNICVGHNVSSFARAFSSSSSTILAILAWEKWVGPLSVSSLLIRTPFRLCPEAFF